MLVRTANLDIANRAVLGAASASVVDCTITPKRFKPDRAGIKRQ